MADIVIPFPFGDLPIKPELTGKIKITDDVTQTLATLLGWDGSARRLVKTSMSGSLQTSASRFGGISTKTSTAPNQIQTYSNVPTTEVMIMGHPDNGEKIWINVGINPTVDNSWPLDAGDVLQLSIDNLEKLKILVVTSGNQVIVLYTR